MSDSSSTAAPIQESFPTALIPSDRDELLRAHVLSKVGPLQRGYLDNSGWAVAALAKLRRAVGVAPGSDPGIWYETLDGVPSQLLGRTEAPSSYELAIHASLTLYAVHQQSRRESMDRRSYPMGRSVRLLARAISKDSLGNDHPVMRRFHALGTASSLAEILHHLRGLITQMRAEGIALDYGQLACDLRRLQDPRRADAVRLQWSRDYHRVDRNSRTGDQRAEAVQDADTDADDVGADPDLNAAFGTA